jgi:Zn-dependent M16 (insulinase) family peptidase
MRNTWLWEKVRVQGGAYGGFSTFDRLSGIFTFLSYRDPNLMSTLTYYDQTADFLQNLDVEQPELIKGIIGAIGEIDAYQLPDSKGFTAMIRYLLNISDTERQLIRDQILETNSGHFKDFSIVLKQLAEKGLIVVLGSSSALESANQINNDFLKITKLL